MKLTGIEKDIYCEESRVRPKNSEVFHLISNNDKAKDLIGWEPEISLEDGLSETIEFVKKNIDLLKQIHIQSKMQAIILAGEKEQDFFRILLIYLNLLCQWERCQFWKLLLCNLKMLEHHQ